MKLDPEIATLSVSHLRVSSAARKAIAKFKSIGDLVEALNIPASGQEKWNKMARPAVEHALRALLISNNHSLDGPSVVFTHPSLRKLNTVTRANSISILHLSERGINALAKINVRTLGEIIDAAREGFRGVPAIGAKTSTEIVESLHALSASVTRTGDADWPAYAAKRGFAVLASEVRSDWPDNKIAGKFWAVAQEAVRIQFGHRGLLIFQERCMRPLCKRPTFREISSRIGRTPQLARNINYTIARMLQRAVWCSDYKGCIFRFHDKFVERLRVCIGTWNRSPDEVPSRAKLDRDSKEQFIVDLLSWRPKPVARESSPPKKHSRVSNEARYWIRHFLTSMFPEGLSHTELSCALRSKLGYAAPSQSEVEGFIKSSSLFENDPANGLCRARLTTLSRGADRCERVLQQSGRPMHYRDIWRVANSNKPNRGKTPDRSIVSRMSPDPRFIPIGGSGFWGLAAWPEFETRPIVEVLTDILKSSKKPLTEERLFQLTTARRPAARKSIADILSANARFQRVAQSTWVLSATHGELS